MEDLAEKITLVICPDTPRVRTYWTLLDVADMQVAWERLALREYVGRECNLDRDQYRFLGSRNQK